MHDLTIVSWDTKKYPIDHQLYACKILVTKSWSAFSELALEDQWE